MRREAAKKVIRKFVKFLKWSGVSVLVGVTVGLVGTLFSHGITFVTAIRSEHPELILGLPFAGVLIVFLYHIARRDNDKGTNSVLLAVRSQEQLPVRLGPLIFISTILTHLFGGSVGRAGASLQIGGSIGNLFARLFRRCPEDEKVIIMCGMSACFATLFGTPMAAAIFSIEVVNVGIMYYSALVPCIFSALIAWGIAQSFGVQGVRITISEVPEFSVLSGGKMVVLAMLAAVVSVLFCFMLHLAAKKTQKWMPNPYVRTAVISLVIIALTALLQTKDYMGGGMDVIEKCILYGEGESVAFFIKMVMTALTLAAGFKGGEIMPTFFIGATFGCMLGGMLDISSPLCAAVGMIAVFCGVTNSPITSLLIALELFGMDAMPYFLIAVAVSYCLSGYHSLYATQTIVYSKYKAQSKELET